MPLSDLQVRLTEVVQRVPGASEFVLAGGGALAVQGIGDRLSDDLDWFADRAEVVEAFAPRFVEACEQAGLTVTEMISEPAFRRYEISDGQDATLVDLAWDARLRPAQRSPYGPVLDRDELAADKTLALFGRAAPRDFVDVYRLLEYYSREELCALAAEKDHGFDTTVFAEMLTRMARYERRDFPVDDATHSQMEQTFQAWSRALAPERRRDIDPPSIVDRTVAPEPPSLGLD